MEHARSALAQVALADRLHDRTDTLSGGQQQRVALARVIAQAPEMVIADEPVSSLDPTLAGAVLELLATVVVGRDRTLVTSLHDVSLARRWCDRLIGLTDGAAACDLPAGAVTDEHTRILYAAAGT